MSVPNPFGESMPLIIEHVRKARAYFDEYPHSAAVPVTDVEDLLENLLGAYDALAARHALLVAQTSGDPTR